MKPLERIRAIWFVVFTLRAWRKSIVEAKGQKGRTLLMNFLTANCYSCIEINAHSLILVMLYLKENQLDHLFYPEFLGSQACESTFRQLRSITTTYSTKTNFSMLEVLNNLYKIDLLNKITHIKLKHINFPNIKVRSNENDSYFPSSKPQENCTSTLPSKIEIIEEVELARLQAIECIETLGKLIKKLFLNLNMLFSLILTQFHSNLFIS